MARIKLNPKPSSQELQEKIRKKAYGLYLERGAQQHGRDWEDWFKAERLVKSEKLA